MLLQKQNFVQFKNLSVNFSKRAVLTSISGSVTLSDKIGLVGMNGSGKSTLLKCLASLILPTSGSILVNSKIVYVSQIDLATYRSEIPLYEYIEERHTDWWDVLQKYTELFGAELDETRRLKTFSGGEIVKLNIATAMSKKPDLLLLDEPTNHLDVTSIDQLESMLLQTNTAFIAVSHNIDFLNSVASTIWEIDNGKLNAYGGNYDLYVAEKERKVQSQIDKYKVTEKKLRKEKNDSTDKNALAAKKGS